MRTSIYIIIQSNIANAAFIADHRTTKYTNNIIVVIVCNDNNIILIKITHSVLRRTVSHGETLCLRLLLIHHYCLSCGYELEQHNVVTAANPIKLDNIRGAR